MSSNKIVTESFVMNTMISSCWNSRYSQWAPFHVLKPSRAFIHFALICNYYCAWVYIFLDANKAQNLGAQSSHHVAPSKLLHAYHALPIHAVCIIRKADNLHKKHRKECWVFYSSKQRPNRNTYTIFIDRQLHFEFRAHATQVLRLCLQRP